MTEANCPCKRLQKSAQSIQLSSSMFVPHPPKCSLRSIPRCVISIQRWSLFKEAVIITPSHWSAAIKCFFCVLFCFFPPCFSTEILHHQGDRGNGRRQQEQFGGAVCHHHQCEEPAAAVGEGELQRGHPRKHRPGHDCRGMPGSGVEVSRNKIKTFNLRKKVQGTGETLYPYSEIISLGTHFTWDSGSTQSHQMK